MKKFIILSMISIFLFFTGCSTKEVKPIEKPVVKPIEKKVPEKKPPVKKKKLSEKKSSEKSKTVSKVITISGVGDIMMGTNYPEKPSYLPPNDGKDLLKEAGKYLKGSDIVFGNLEGPLLNDGATFKKCKKCFTFKVPEHYVKHLVSAGFNLMSLANNHAGDFGKPGRERTSALLKKNRIEFAGTLDKPYSLFRKNGVTYGFCAFAPNYGTPDLRDIKGAVSIVKKLAKTCDIIIVSFHGGAEGKENRNVTRKDEYFYGENRGNVYDFAHKVIDAGADVVFGHGPHIARAVELYKNRFIAYSLGNFCTYARFNLLGPNGVAPVITLKVKKTGEFLSGRIIPMFQVFKKGPALDPEKRAIKEISKLTKEDFPKTNLLIDKEGNIKTIENVKLKIKKQKPLSH